MAVFRMRMRITVLRMRTRGLGAAWQTIINAMQSYPDETLPKSKSIWRVMNRYAGEICDGLTESECGKPSHSNSNVEEMKTLEN